MSVGIMDATNMSRAYYFSTFLQTMPPTPEQTKMLLKGKFIDGVEKFVKEDSLTHALCYAEIESFEKSDDKIKPQFMCDSIKHSGKYSLLTNSENPFSKALEPTIETLTKKSYTWVKATIWAFSKQPADSLKGELVLLLKHKGHTFKYKSYSINPNNFKPNIWNRLEFYLLTPDDLRSTKDLVGTFFWNTGKNNIYVDDLTIEAYEPIIDKSVF